MRGIRLVAPVDTNAARLRAWRKGMRDFPWFCKTFVRIRNKDGRLVPFVLNNAQMRVWLSIKEEWDQGRAAWIVLLKARQQGCSTLAMALLLWLLLRRSGQQALSVVHREKEGKQIFRKIELMWEKLPDEVRPPKAVGSRDGDRLAFKEPLGSMIVRESAENVVVGRSGTFQHAHLTELPWWNDADTSMGGMIPTLPSGAGCLVLVESTAEAMGDYFHGLWEEAGEKTSPWKQCFSPWFLSEEYRRTHTKDDYPLTAAERVMRDEYDLSLDQVMWYRDTLSKMKGDIDRMRKEYPGSPREAFRASGSPYFTREAIDRYDTLVARYKPLRAGYLEVGEDLQPKFVDDEFGPWRIYERPVAGRSYIVAADVAGGTATGDRSSADVLDAESLKQVASFLGKLDPDDYAYELAAMGYSYNTALIAAERNGEGRATVLALHKRIGYPRLFTHIPEDNIKAKQGSTVGWVTSPKTRPTMLAQLATLIRGLDVGIRDDRTTKELDSFVRVPGSHIAEAAPGAFDDSVMSLAIGCNSEVRSQALSSAEWDEGDYEPGVSVVTAY